MGNDPFRRGMVGGEEEGQEGEVVFRKRGGERKRDLGEMKATFSREGGLGRETLGERKRGAREILREGLWERWRVFLLGLTWDCVGE